MKRLIYFDKNNALVKAFCNRNSSLVSKKLFSSSPHLFQNTIAVCYGLSNFGEVLVAKKNNIDYVYIDNCYFGNINSYYTDEKRKKNFYRIVLNNLVINKFIQRPDDRLKKQLEFIKVNFGIEKYIEDFKYDGNDVIIVPPSGKVIQICNINVEKWIKNIRNKVKGQNSELNIIIRNRSNFKDERFKTNPIHSLLDSAHSIITYGSMSAVEAVIFGVPSFICNDNNSFIKSAAAPVSRLNIENINERLFPKNRYEWLSSLSYSQFSREEIISGFAREFVLGRF